MQEPADPTAGVTLGSLPGPSAVPSRLRGRFYYDGKHGVTPANGPPAYDFGTDGEVWDAFGIPLNWQNHIAGVDCDADGVNGASPPGSTSPQDGFMGLDSAFTLGPGDSAPVYVLCSSGRNTPMHLCFGNFDKNGVVDLADLGLLPGDFGCVGPCCKRDADLDGDADLVDLGIVPGAFGAICQ